ncbi:Carrier protein YMC1, mitochondrial [Cladophialophora carrionii]|uniref:Carrier protein YMC1, mitochondrial n=1 Tax=Cladophialophora carrionii TaxID=86049 RepID=A0A1C1C8A3_9EURO|nr:Carrier protein YMC1, mitochondrial [Cladophialophora carrionii]
MVASSSPTNLGGAPATNAVAGAAGGVVSVLLGQPFDLIKVRLQTHNSSNALRVVSDIFRKEGPLAFYKFSVFHSAKHALERLKDQSSHSNGRKLANLDFYLAGGAAGIANSIVSGPVEHIRIRLQMQPTGTGRLYSGPWDCMRKLSGVAGIRGVFKGQNIAVLREFQAYGCYFVTFEACIQMMADAREKRREDLPTWSVASCGASAGVAFWIGSYPLDVIKTKLQNDGFGPDRQYKSAWAATVQTWKGGKLPAFFRGLGPTLLRTVLSSSGTFAM